MRFLMRPTPILAVAPLVIVAASIAFAQSAPIVLERDGSTIAVEPYAPNIVRVTLSTLKDQVTAAPGYGIVGKPESSGWSHDKTSDGDTIKSSRMTLFFAAPAPPTRRPDGTFYRGPQRNFNGAHRGAYLSITANGKS